MAMIRLEINLPDELIQAFLQAVRNFDIGHDPGRTGLVHIMMGIEAPTLSAQTVQAIFNSIRPPFDQEGIFPQPGNA